MGEHPPALQEHFRHITRAQLVPQSPQDHLQDDISGIFQILERGTGAFSEDASAGPTAECSIATSGFLVLFLGRC